MVAAHNGSIPFENLDPLLGIPIADLSVAALTDKLVCRRRGGYCHKHNGLMGYVLEALGFGVERLAGRVVWMNPLSGSRAASRSVSATGTTTIGAGIVMSILRAADHTQLT
jgi:arylamine N-acetyltransferase